MIHLAAKGPNLLAGETVRHEGGGTELLAAIEPITDRCFVTWHLLCPSTTFL
jgi:hypothetical protein